MLNDLDFLKSLSQTFGVSGYEKEVSSMISNEIKSFADSVTIDNFGNLIAFKAGTGINKKKIMVSAHMDEIGFAVTTVTDKGYVKVRSLGAVLPAAHIISKVRFKNGTPGIMCSEEIGGGKDITTEKLFIDIGAKSKEEALRKVSIGEPVCCEGDFFELGENYITGKALDDRIGCFICVECVKEMISSYNDVYFVFSAQEELGARGAKVAAARIMPDIGIAVDITSSYDTPMYSGGNMVLGQGACIKVMDNSVICDEYLNDMLVSFSRENGIKYQMDVLPGGGTDAGSINLSNFGVKTTGISIPTRYGHSSYAVVDLEDVEACIRLIQGYLQSEFRF
jgi:putative aminopeptidase FrvX